MNFSVLAIPFCALVYGLVAAPQPAAAQTIPFWKSSFFFNSTTYTIRLVGSDPAQGAMTTLVANTIVPMKLIFSDGNVLDAQREVAPLLASPIFSSAVFPSGTTQYADAVLRAELWPAVQGSNYHVLLDTPSVAPEYLLTVPSNEGSTMTGPHGQVTGTVDYQWFVKTVQPTVVTQLGIAPTSLTIFVTHNLLLKRPGNACCFHGNHSAFVVHGPAGKDLFTTVWAGMSPGNADTMSHEINEWANDPFNDNVVPSWRIPGVNDCNTTLEVGDPLVGATFSAGGFIVQDVAYVEWFSRQQPSMALGGQYDVLGKLTTPAQDCL
ncbi:MAG TPA: hypothetical protein VID19_06920 [Candidatus Eremiobacteraceae bacterium]